VLERADDARARGVRPLAELAGAGASSDAHHMTAPDPEGRGPALALERALADAGIEPGEIDLVDAHGTGTELNDLAEYRALERVLGPCLFEIPIALTKASVGHLLGSAGAIEAVATVLALVTGRIPAAPGGGEIDPRTPVRLAGAAGPFDRPPRVAVSLNLAFGGCNAALVLRRWDGDGAASER
jgi:3-oxoacyl-[acyl-carrier-protein] synthase II